MCSSRSICSGNSRANRSSGSGSGSGAHYALCALGVGLIALGIVMIVWTVIPLDGEASDSSNNNSSGNSTAAGPTGEDEEDESKDTSKSSSVAMVLVGVGGVMLLLSICLGVRSKKRAREARNQPVAPVAAALMEHVAGDLDSVTYTVPSYDEVVGSNDYPVRNSNLRSSTSQLPSYEDIIAAVENEGREPANITTEDNTPPLEPPTQPAQPAAAEGHHPPLTANPSLPTRSQSRASRLLRPLRVRRIKSDKLHLKDFRIQIRTPTQNPVTIEPITPPPQYDNNVPELTHLEDE